MVNGILPQIYSGLNPRQQACIDALTSSGYAFKHLRIPFATNDPVSLKDDAFEYLWSRNKPSAIHLLRDDFQPGTATEMIATLTHAMERPNPERTEKEQQMLHNASYAIKIDDMLAELQERIKHQPPRITTLTAKTHPKLIPTENFTLWMIADDYRSKPILPLIEQYR